MYIRANSTIQRLGKLTTTILLLVTSQATIELVTYALLYNKQRQVKIDECLDGLENLTTFNFEPQKLIKTLGLTVQVELAIHIYLCLYVYSINKQVIHMPKT